MHSVSIFTLKVVVMNNFLNASPNIIFLGADDKSRRVLPDPEIGLPQHCPLFYVYTEKGPITRTLVTSENVTDIFGSAVLDPSSKFFTHQSRYLNNLLGYGNTCMLQRLVPEDAKTANVVVYANVEQTTSTKEVTVQQPTEMVVAHTDGEEPSLTTQPVDSTDTTVSKTVTTTEYKLYYTTEHLEDLTQLVESDSKFPLLVVKAKHAGKYYNNIGFSIDVAPVSEQDDTVNKYYKVLLFNLSLWTRPNTRTKPTVLRTRYGSPYAPFTFKENFVNKETSKNYDLNTTLEQNWLSNIGLANLLGIDFIVYKENYHKLVNRILESFNIEQNPDDDYTLEYLVNPFTNISVLGHTEKTSTWSLDQDKGLINLTTPIFLYGGEDGTTTDRDKFEQSVIDNIKLYGDENSFVQDLALNIESFFYDTGFKLKYKKDLTNFIKVRKDTVLVLSTYSDGEAIEDAGDSKSKLDALHSTLANVSESTYYGTKVARAIIGMGTGEIIENSLKKTVPLTYELSGKIANLMGGSDGRWRRGGLFDNYPGNKINNLVNVQPEFIPADVKPALWDLGAIWAQPFDRFSFHIPAMQTVYSDDTSVLNNFFVICAMAYLNKIGDRVWRKFVGTATLTDNEFISQATSYTNSLLGGKFDDLVTVVPTVELTEADVLRGYSWRIIFKIYAANIKTVAVVSTEVYRISDLSQS